MSVSNAMLYAHVKRRRNMNVSKRSILVRVSPSYCTKIRVKMTRNDRIQSKDLLLSKI